MEAGIVIWAQGGKLYPEGVPGQHITPIALQLPSDASGTEPGEL